MDDNVRAYFGRVPFSQAFCSAYMKWIYFPFFDHHIANSEYTADELRSATQGQLVTRGTWIRPMGVDLRHLSPTRRSAQRRRRLLENFSAAEDAVLLLYAGRLVPEKNLPLLFEVLKRLANDDSRDYRLLVVGDGIQRELWGRKCERTVPGRAFFFGHIGDQNVLADLYANSDIFVHPNPREPFGIAPLEAMTSGLPLVAPNSGGITSYANADNAWLVNADVDSFAAAVKAVAANPVLAAERARRALATAHHYCWESTAASFFELYKALKRHHDGTGPFPPPAFSSTPASAFQAGLMRGSAYLAKSAFQLCSTAFGMTGGGGLRRVLGWR